MEIHSHTQQDTFKFGEALGKASFPGAIILLNGDLGAGKTHLTQGIATGLGVTEPCTSPTFTYMIEYTSGRLPLYHFDLYRLEDFNQLEDIAFFELLEAEGVSVVEWAQKFPEAEPAEYMHIYIEKIDETSRVFRIKAQGDIYIQMLDAVASRLDSSIFSN
ncbi:MAG: tRNA (adenosine(37)-N6)-threonylcarbamoyltransferase complex ATPase subunit type 1 TsaE [Eggerthellaceae bacterium]|nr:tRNA (adenosine(37)-N6)-threonylcarbamoyltransferase complex ATPase subunit type 1 TsaE [Eggerthellaceae bacterium]